MADTTYTDEQIAQMRAAVAADDARKAKEIQDRRDAYIKPVEDLVGGDAWKAVFDGLSQIETTYADDNFLSVHVRALVEIMPRLVSMISFSKAMTATVTTSTTTDTTTPSSTSPDSSGSSTGSSTTGESSGDAAGTSTGSSTTGSDSTTGDSTTTDPKSTGSSTTK